MQALEFGHYLARVPIARREEYSGAAQRAAINPDSEVKNRARARRRARARSVGIVRRNKARIFSHHFVALA
jgi:hypothetical protein